MSPLAYRPQVIQDWLCRNYGLCMARTRKRWHVFLVNLRRCFSESRRCNFRAFEGITTTLSVARGRTSNGKGRLYLAMVHSPGRSYIDGFQLSAAAAFTYNEPMLLMRLKNSRCFIPRCLVYVPTSILLFPEYVPAEIDLGKQGGVLG